MMMIDSKKIKERGESRPLFVLSIGLVIDRRLLILVVVLLITNLLVTVV